MYLIFRRLLLITAAAALAVPGMQGQATTPKNTSQPEVDLALTYANQYSNLVRGGNFWLQGGTAELSAGLYRGFGVVANVSGTRIENINGSGRDLTMITTAFGPRYTWETNSRKIAVFGETLIGESHGANSAFPTIRGFQTDSNSFALLLGGGIDLRLSRHFAVRPFQAEWLRTQFPNGTTNVQNNLRLESGIVLRFFGPF